MLSPSISTALAPIAANRYWREEDAERVLAVWMHSGLTLSGFARQCGLSVSRLRRWKKRLESGDGPRFHPVEVVSAGEPAPSDPAIGDGGVELILGGGHRIAVRRGFDPALLHELIETLGRC